MKINGNKKTAFLSAEAAVHQKNWVVIDAKNQTLGRLSTEIARLLRGKHKPQFSPHVDGGDYVVVINAAQVKLTGQKWTQKLYHRHSGYMGGLKFTIAADLIQKKPTELVYLAVKGMLAKQKLRDKMLNNLKLFAGDSHHHQAQKPVPPPSRLASL